MLNLLDHLKFDFLFLSTSDRLLPFGVEEGFNALMALDLYIIVKTGEVPWQRHVLRLSDTALGALVIPDEIGPDAVQTKNALSAVDAHPWHER